jgi:hypothetical protein
VIDAAKTQQRESVYADFRIFYTKLCIKGIFIEIYLEKHPSVILKKTSNKIEKFSSVLWKN